MLAAASQQPHNRYFQDLPDDVISDDTRCQQALQRRHLAVPLYHDRAEGTETLDAAQPSGRAKITELWLAGRGIPQDQRASYQELVEELWTGEPPQVTEQALRMAADGLNRDAILDKLVQDRYCAAQHGPRKAPRDRLSAHSRRTRSGWRSSRAPGRPRTGTTITSAGGCTRPAIGSLPRQTGPGRGAWVARHGSAWPGCATTRRRQGDEAFAFRARFPVTGDKE